ncbi:MAG TPA: phosphate ABC transporter permease PstA, partial [Chthoniobacterales bacterium]
MKPRTSNAKRSRIVERGAFWLFRLAAYVIIAAATYIFLDIGIKGSRTLFTSTPPFINVEFLSDRPQTLYVFDFEGKKMTLGDQDYRAWQAAHPDAAVEPQTVAYSAGGIWPAIAGTALLVIGSMTLALFIGISSAIYLSEYARGGPFIRLVRVAILNLAGVPSIVFGLFGFGLFVIFFGWNVSLLAGWFTLGLMILPAIITASEESLRAVPQGLREGSLALGATKWQTIWKQVLPGSIAGIATGVILALSRAIGETAPLLVIGAAVNPRFNP